LPGGLFVLRWNLIDWFADS